MKYRPRLLMNELGISFQIWKNKIWPVLVLTYWYPDKDNRFGQFRRYR